MINQGETNVDSDNIAAVEYKYRYTSKKQNKYNTNSQTKAKYYGMIKEHILLHAYINKN